ncbi:MAG: YjbQ family protein [Anaerolinea sp.]|nr:YjbQ family protein [Anaerolinea sp.]
MNVQTDTLQLQTSGHADIHDITMAVARAVTQSGLHSGIVIIFCPSSTSAVTTLEFEPGCVQDLQRLFDEIVAPNRPYAHNARWGDGNGHSHARAALLGASLTVPFVAQRLTLGTWQQIVYVDFDNRARRRELILQIIGAAVSGEG